MKKLFIAILFIISFVCIASNPNLYASDSSNCNIIYGNECNLYLENDCYLLKDEINLTIYTTFSNEVKEFIIEEDGINVEGSIEHVNDEIKFTVRYDGIHSKPYLKLTIVFDNGNTTYVQLFGYIKNDKVYLNAYSYQEAIEVYNYYNKLYKEDLLKNILSSVFLLVLVVLWFVQKLMVRLKLYGYMKVMTLN